MRNCRWRMLLLVGMIAIGSPAAAQKVKTVEPEPVKTVKTVKTVGKAETVDQILTRLFASAALAPMRAPDRVEALPMRAEGMGLSSTYHVVEKPVALGPKTAQRVSATLLDKDSYEGGISACMFDPGITFRFHKGTESVQAQVCFMCGEVIFETVAGRSLSRRLTLGEGRAPLLAAARRAFPNNAMLDAMTK
jgi:hypothetical protein